MLPAQVEREAGEGAFEVLDAATVGGAGRKRSGRDLIFIRDDRALFAEAVVEAERHVGLERGHRIEVDPLRALERAREHPVVLQPLGVVYERLELGVFLAVHAVDVVVEAERARASVFQHPQRRIATAVAVAEARRVGLVVGERSLIASPRAKVRADRIAHAEGAVVAVHALALAGAEVAREAVGDGVVAAFDARSVRLREPVAVQQVLGAVEEEELRLRRVVAQARFEVALRGTGHTALGEDLNDAVGGIGAVERGGRAAGNELHAIDVIERQIGDGAGGRALRAHAGHVHAERGDGVEVVHAHAVHVDDGRGVVAHRGDAAGAHDRRGAGLARRHADLCAGQIGLQQFVEAARRRRFDFLTAHDIDRGGDASLGDFTALTGDDHGIEVERPHGEADVSGERLSGGDGDRHHLGGIADHAHGDRATAGGHFSEAVAALLIGARDATDLHEHLRAGQRLARAFVGDATGNRTGGLGVQRSERQQRCDKAEQEHGPARTTIHLMLLMRTTVYAVRECWSRYDRTLRAAPRASRDHESLSSKCAAPRPLVKRRRGSARYRLRHSVPVNSKIESARTFVDCTRSSMTQYSSG